MGLFDLVAGFGRGVMKILSSLVVGVGVGMVTFGYLAVQNGISWEHSQPPGELVLSVGAGLLACGGSLWTAFVHPFARPSQLVVARRCGSAPMVHEAI